MKKYKNWGMLALIMMFWFTISFITNILGPLIPDIIHNFELKDLVMAGFIPTSFFIAYAVMSIPAGILIDKYGERIVLFTGFLMPFIGSILFACLPYYSILLLSSFIIGLGMAMLQTVLNPLQRAVGGEENYAFVAELAQFVFGTASFVSPLVYTYLIHALAPENYRPGNNMLFDFLAQLTPVTLPWVSLYWIFTLLLFFMLIMVILVDFPHIELKEDHSGSSASYKTLFKQKYVWLFFFGIFCYVSTEQGVSVFMSTFLEQYHDIDPKSAGAQSISYFWGLMTIGCLFGMVLLKLIDSRRLLQISGVFSFCLLFAALFGPTNIAICAFPAIGFSISMMYSIVFSLALNTASHNHGSFAGILCSGIVGGAGGPLLISLLSDATSLRMGMSLIFVFIGYITFIGFYARPLINNKTMRFKDLFALISFVTFCIPLAACGSHSSDSLAVIKVTKEALMNEVRITPSPSEGAHITMNPPRFMWPDKYPHLGAVLDGVPGYVDYKPKVLYRIRISQNKSFRGEEVIVGEQPYAFFNPFRRFETGEWFWQYAYVTPEGKEEWSPIYSFHVDENTPVFNPPSLDEVLSRYPTGHPRILLDGKQWDAIIERNKDNPEAQGYIKKALVCLSCPLKPLQEEIDTTNVVTLSNVVQRESALIRESRKIVDREEANVEALVRAYLLTKDRRFYREGINRLSEILSWRQSNYFAGDFNLSTLLSMGTSAYDGFHALLTQDEKTMLLENIAVLGKKFYDEYINHLENRIADNHVWQMTFRILTMAAFATLNEIPDATTWAEYCYNEWISRMPGLNKDGAWHNGDSYFHVNIRTLIEVPVFFSRISGFDFFADPWYANNALYVIYQQPPFSKSGGHGNSHENQRTPTGGRVGYADALARETGNPWAAAYVHEIMQQDPDILGKAFEAKPQDLTWYRCTTLKALPPQEKRLAELPPVKVFNETGTALMHTDIGHYENNAMLSFRSSPYGSTSHALANQNAFNTFFGGKAIFYSTGHRTGFTDDHCMYAYRNTRAHNTILAGGMTQKIGTEGYGWIPRYYEGNKISYVVGDASHAYGRVTSPLWLERARLSGTRFTPANGWDENKVEWFRRHIVQLGNSGFYVIYDELEGKEAVEWNYLLHTTELPMTVEVADGGLRITGKNRSGGVSVAHLFSSEKMTYQLTDTFFVPAVDWKNRLGKKLNNHYHFMATTTPSIRTCFLNIIDVHGNNRSDAIVQREDGHILVGDWTILCNLANEDTFLEISNEQENLSLRFDYATLHGKSVITDCLPNGETVTVELCDKLPELEI